ncbi:MAG TPA: DUF6398 domain-containing protein [Hyalangium sp.]|nr:DUF6398 domain-containing protein [Hyalangium sp.]
MTDRFCSEHLDAEYGELCRKMIDKLARKRPSPLVRGRVSIWAGAVLYSIGSVNFLFDPQQPLHLSASQLSTLTGIPQSTLANKARIIRDLLRIVPLQPEFCRRDLLADNPLAWLIQVNGVIVDARTMPPEIQEEARRKGLIPNLT